jgi:hypothetical protein
MKFEFSLEKIKSAISRINIWVFVAGVWIGIMFMLVFTQSPQITEKTQQACLTINDLNRSDIGASIVLSRFCEGMGLQSSVLWQQDQQGNEYGVPICLKGNT